MATELATEYVSLTFKYGNSLRQLNSQIAGIEKTASRSGDKIGKSLTDGIARAKLDTSAMNKLAEQMGSNAGARIANGLRRTIGRERLPVPSVDPKLAGDVGGNLGAVIGQRLRSVLKREGDSAGQELTSSLERGSRKSGENAGKGLLGGFAGVVGKGVVGAAGVAIGGIGYALTKGFERLSAIDEAKAKLIGLGNSAESVERIMTSATDAVKGTAFSLDEAATTAAAAVATGIKPGQELTKYLTSTADAAAIAGTSLAEMGSIFNNVQTNGTAMTDDLQQLADRGLPIFTWLQKEYGVTGEQLRKMVEKGQVDSATFQKVIAENIGGAAQKMGNSTGGAFKNMQAAIGRFGAALAGPIFNQAGKAFNSLTGIIDKATTGVGPVMEKVGDTLGKVFGDKVVPILDEVGPIASDVFSKIGDTAKAAAPSLLEVGRGIGDFLGKMLEAGKSVLPTFGKLFKTVWESIRGIVVTVAPAVSNALKPILSSLGNLGKSLAPVARVLLTVLGGAFKGLAAILGPVVKVILNVAGAVLPKLIDAVTWLVNKLTAAGPALKAVFTGIGTAAMWLWNNAIKPAWDGIGTSISITWENIIKPVAGFLVDAFQAPGKAALWFWQNAIVPAWDGIKTAFSTAWDFISGIFDKLTNGFNTAKGVVVGVARAIADGVKTAFSGLAAIIKAPLHALGSFLSGIPTSVFGVDIPGASTLNSWGKNLQGLAGGGLVRGPGSGTSDSVLAWLSNGEGVVTAKAMANGGAGLVAALNAGWVPPVDLLKQMLPGFAQGGVAGAIQFAQQFGDGRKYLYGGVGPAGFDCSGYMSAIYGVITGQDPFKRYFTTESNFEALGFQKGFMPGAFNIGVRRGGGGPNSHMAGTLPNGVNVESGGKHGSTEYGGDAAGAMDFPIKYFLPLSGNPLGGVTGSSLASGATAGGGGSWSGGGSSGGGGTASDPMTKAAESLSNSAGELADIGVGGLKESLLPEGFSDPTQWGAFKAASTLLRFFGGLRNISDGKPLLGEGGAAFANITGAAMSGSGSGVVDAIKGIIPQPFGTQSAQPNDFQGNTQGGGSGGSGIAGAAGLATSFIPSPGEGQSNDQSTNVNFNGPVGANAGDVVNKVNDGYNSNWRRNFGTARVGAP